MSTLGESPDSAEPAPPRPDHGGHLAAGPTTANELNATLSPNGRWLAYQSDRSGQHEILVSPFPNVEAGSLQLSTSGGSRPAWSPDGNALFYLDGDGFLAEVAVSPDGAALEDKPARRVLNTRYLAGVTPRGVAMRGYDIARDGKGFLMIKDASPAQDQTKPAISIWVNWGEDLQARLTAR